MHLIIYCLTVRSFNTSSLSFPQFISLLSSLLIINKFSPIQYDLGGPLICRKDGKAYQVGIGNDWRKGKASIFTRVSAYYDWIKQNIIDHEGLA